MTIVIDHEYHGIEVSTIPTHVLVWIVDKFGPAGDRWFVKHGWESQMLYFKSEKDHLLFLITWGK